MRYRLRTLVAQFSIRDMLWLTLLVGSLTAWWLNHRHTVRTDSEKESLRLDNLAKSQALEIAAKKQANLRKEVDLLGQLARNREVELQKRDADLRDSLSKREAMLDALRTLKDLPANSN